MEALLPLIITFGLMWALLIRPQQRRVRQHQDLVATLTAGDEVITSGGIVGTIASVVDDIVTLEVAPGTSIRVLRSAVQSRIAPFEAEDAFEADEYDQDEYDALLDEAARDDRGSDDDGPPPPVAPPTPTPAPPTPTPPAPSTPPATPAPPTPPTPPATPPAGDPPPTGEKA